MVLPARAGTIKAATLVAVGGRDPLIDGSRWIASWWPRARLLVVPEADHANIAQRREVLVAMRELMAPGVGR
jgi:pimeloyl-ACP methyl ester carboxylesterase